MHPSYKKTQAELLVLDRALPTIKSEWSGGIYTCIGKLVVCGSRHRYSTWHATSRLLSGVLQASRPIAFALSCRQSAAITGAAGWSTRRVRPTVPPVVLLAARCQVRYG
ncbi:hypothetical protein GW17_00022089 [Ensete ventricosum]|nr:hypothetical protein GW17_00022089 [Ensete ventricosum]